MAPEEKKQRKTQLREKPRNLGVQTGVRAGFGDPIGNYHNRPGTNFGDPIGNYNLR
ncbi:MAG: hypothetical protein HY901_02760 [Deltaproteobacteria bacterium]|nr:hypothetical protein [Deltaproteobacteria bacterium]